MELKEGGLGGLSRNIELNNLTCSYPGESVQASNKLLCVQQPMNDVCCFVDSRIGNPELACV